MNFRTALLAACLVGLPVTAVSAAATAPAMSSRLIPRADLFGPAVKSAAQLSPDGRMLAWLAPVGDVLNVFVAPLGNMAAAKAVTNEAGRPIRSYFWAPDSRRILYVNDKGGDENFNLFGVDVASGQATTLTPFDKTTVEIVAVSNSVPERILVGINNRDARYHDVYSLDLSSAKLTPVMMNMGGYSGFLADDRLVLRGASKADAQGGSEFFPIIDGKIADKASETIGLDDSETTSPAGYTTDGKTLYWIDSRGRDTAALIAQDVATGAKRVIAEDARADIGSVLANPRTGQAEAYGVNYLRNDWHPIGSAVVGDLAFLKARFPKAQFAVTSRTYADDKWLVGVDSVTEPSSTWLYDRSKKSLTRLYVSRPALVGAPLVPMYPVEIRSRDGLTLPSYLTLPIGADANHDGRADRPVPMVLLVHGGPWGRDGYGSNTYHQWLANRGYAVLSVNFRASTGFGKKFIKAGNLEWGRKMHDDLLDGVDWAIKNGVTTRDKVAIMGGSYGGYATLAALTVTPTAFACGVDIVGPSNLETLLKTIPAYWESGRAQMAQRMGNPDTGAGRALLKDRSPLFMADRIVRPLLIGQGANDPRVNVRESEQIVAAMKAKNIPVTYVLFPDEGHGFQRPVNNIAFNAVAENFLGKCLGGGAEAIGTTIAQSTAKVPDGAGLVPGLGGALK